MVQNEKMLSVGGLAAGMAHEINNPMAGIVQTVNVLANRLIKKPNMPANIKAAENAGISMESISEFMEFRGIPRMIDSINDSARRVTTIIENMLSFSRKSKKDKSSHDLSVLIYKTLQIAHSDLSFKIDKNTKIVKIQKEYEEDVPLVFCEGSKIQQVIFNILRNGVQAMENGRIENPEFIIRLLYNKKTEMVKVEIEDNGPGMTENIRKRVFEPFFTTKPIGVGTGLGLSVSYFIITNNLEGSISVESKPDDGTKFIIQFPLKSE